MFGKSFASMYTGSMCGAGVHVFALWNYAIANADPEGFVELNPRYVASVLGCAPADLEAALEYLERPDPHSRNQADEGRRLVREGQFLRRIVSYRRYREMRDMEAKREYDRKYAAARRDKKRRDTTSRKESLQNTTNRKKSLQSSQEEGEGKEEATKSELTKESSDNNPSDAGASAADVPPVIPPPQETPTPKAPTKTELKKQRHAEFKAALTFYWAHVNMGVQCPWDGAEGKALEMFLSANPKITIEQFRQMLNNRKKSDVNQGERPSRWVRSATDYMNGPVVRFGKPKGQGNEKRIGNTKADRTIAAAAEALALIAARYGDDGDGPEAGSGSEPEGLGSVRGAVIDATF